MRVQVAPFVPTFILGGVFLIAPGLVVTLFTNSEPIGVAVVVATGLAALIRPQASWFLFAVLCSLRTVPFLIAFAVAVAMRIGLARHGLPWLVLWLAVGVIAQIRIHFLRRSGEVDI